MRLRTGTSQDNPRAGSGSCAGSLYTRSGPAPARERRGEGDWPRLPPRPHPTWGALSPRSPASGTGPPWAGPARAGGRGGGLPREGWLGRRRQGRGADAQVSRPQGRGRRAPRPSPTSLPALDFLAPDTRRTPRDTSGGRAPLGAGAGDEADGRARLHRGPNWAQRARPESGAAGGGQGHPSGATAPPAGAARGVGGSGPPARAGLRGVQGCGCGGLRKRAPGDSFLLMGRAGIQGLSKSPGREAGEGRGHSQSLDTSSLLRRFLGRAAPRTPGGSPQGRGSGAGTRGAEPSAPRCRRCRRETGCPGEGRGGAGSQVSPPRAIRRRKERPPSALRPPLAASEREIQGGGRAQLPAETPLRRAGGLKQMEVKRGAPETGREMRGCKPQSGGGGPGGRALRRCCGPGALGDSLHVAPRPHRTRPPPHPPPLSRGFAPSSLRGGEEKPHIWSQSWPLPASVAMGGAEDRLTELLNPFRLGPCNGLEGWGPWLGRGRRNRAKRWWGEVLAASPKAEEGWSPWAVKREISE